MKLEKVCKVIKAAVRAVLILEDASILSGEGNVLFKNDSVVCELPVDEKIIRLVQGTHYVYILTEFSLFRLSKDFEIERITFQGRDRPLSIFESEKDLWLVSARGRLHNLRTQQIFQLQSDATLFYSAAIYVDDVGSVIVAFGTIFSGVLIAELKEDGIFKESFTLSGHKGTVFDVQFHPSNRQILFSCSDDRNVIKWNLQTEVHQKFIGHEARVWQLAVSPEVVCSVSEDNTCRIWTHEGHLETVIECNQFAKNTLSVAFSGSLVVIGSSDHSRYIYDRSKRSQTLLQDLKPESSETKNFCLDSDGTIFLSTATGEIYQNSVLLAKIDSLARYSVPCVAEELLVIGDVFGSIHYTRKSEISFRSLSICKGKISKILYLDRKRFLVELNEQKCFIFAAHEVIELRSERKFKCTSALLTEDLLYVGSRNGDLMEFDLNGNFVQILSVTFGESLKALARENNSLLIGTHSGELITVNLLQFKVTQKRPICKGEIVSFCSNNSILAVFQQNSLNFIDRQSGLIVDKINCKGSHRLWSLTEAKNSAFFAFLSDGLLTLSKVQFDRLKQTVPSHHGQEIRCSIAFDGVVASGSEDGSLVISCKGRTIDSVRSPKNSSIKSLCFKARTLFSAGASESLDAWKWKDSTLTHLASAPKVPALIESRVMAIDSNERADGSLKVFAGYSNSSVACWSFSSETGFKLDWIHEEVHHGKFLQQLKLVDNQLITAGTDGLVKLWDIESSALKLSTTVCAHSSGINAFDIFNDRKIVTGGDDGFISVIELQSSKLKLLNRTQAHHSTCTAVKFLSESLVVSASTDQRIILRNLDRLDPVTARISSISDIASLSVERDDRGETFISVYGIGQESFVVN